MSLINEIQTERYNKIRDNIHFGNRYNITVSKQDRYSIASDKICCIVEDVVYDNDKLYMILEILHFISYVTTDKVDKNVYQYINDEIIKIPLDNIITINEIV